MPPSPLRLAITPGEPAGIGGEILLKAIAAGAHANPAGLLTLDDPARLRALADDMGMRLNAAEVASPAEAATLPPDCLAILPIRWAAQPVPGRPDAANAKQVIEAIARAAHMAQAGEVAGIVTCPIHKATLTGTGFAHSGHTGFLGEIDGDATRPVMMLCSEAITPPLRVIPLTTHIPLADVPQKITAARINAVARITHAALKKSFGIAAPRLALTGLNPHAGEDGTMGREETEIITPALAALRDGGMDITGPHPADTMFRDTARKEYDAAIAMYHDQALTPIKTIAFDSAVNVTLGLGFIRTSPDHGTALDIAGKGKARAESLIAAIALARRMADCPRLP